MYPGSWKLEKIEVSDFFEILFTRGHEIEVSDFCEKSWKLEKIEASDFCVILWTRGHKNWRKLKCQIFVWFYVSEEWKLEKIEASDFCEILCTRGHENWRKKSIRFLCNFVYGVMKIGENWSVRFLCNFVYPGSWKLKKNKACHENWRKLKCMIFVKIHVPRKFTPLSKGQIISKWFFGVLFSQKNRTKTSQLEVS